MSDLEPEKYSIDEMMDRLKSRESSVDKGELVKRSDGTMAVRTKKRKRRTNQTVNKEQKRNQRIQILQLAAFVVLLLLMFFVAGLGILYANSSSFRKGLISKVENTTGATVVLHQFRMNPATANASKVNMDWPSSGLLQQLEVHSVIAKIEPISFLGRSFRGEEIVANRGDLILRVPEQGQIEATESPSDGGGKIRFQRYAVPNLNIYYGDSEEKKLVLEKTEASFFPSKIRGHGEIRLNKGRINFENWLPLQLDRSYINVKAKELEVRSMRLLIPSPDSRKAPDRGILELSGELLPYQVDGVYTLGVKLDGFRLSPLLGRDLGRFFLGRVVTIDEIGANFLSLDPEQGTAALEVAISNAIDSRIDLASFRFLSFLALTLDDRWYDLPNFSSKASAILKRRGQEVELTDINFEERGRMALRGALTTNDEGIISGALRVGIPESMIAASKNGRLDSIFGIVREGYRWVDLEIGGSSSEPTDNFKELYESASASANTSSGQNTPEDSNPLEEEIE
ncbi:MAG: hypothetical protein AB8D78_01240 [Akkermansiaceae bacterium]